MALALTCRFCNSLNCKALGENTMCYDCGRLAEGSLKLIEVEPVVTQPAPPAADITAPGTDPDPALTAAVAAAEVDGPGDAAEPVEDPEPAEGDGDVDDFDAALSALGDDEPAVEPLPEDSPLKP